MDTVLVVLVVVLVGVLGAFVVLGGRDKGYTEAQLQERLRQNADETLRRSSATLKGQIGERFAPFVPGFGYEPAGARFLGSPVDYVVFDGISEGEIRGIVFIEVKTGSLPLTPFQKQIKQAIEERRVTWRVVELPDR